MNGISPHAERCRTVVTKSEMIEQITDGPASERKVCVAAKRHDWRKI
jgi:hypothetical protein